MLNCGSVIPNAWPLRNNWIVTQLACAMRPDRDADRYRNDHAEQTKTRHDGGAVARDRIIGPGDRDEHRACAVREKHREPHDGADDNSDDQEEHESRQQNLGEDTTEADFAEPQPVRVHADQVAAPRAARPPLRQPPPTRFDCVWTERVNLRGAACPRATLQDLATPWRRNRLHRSLRPRPSGLGRFRPLYVTTVTG